MPITINELRIDQPSDDLDEYLELAGTPGESLDGLAYLVIGDSPAGGSGVVEAVVGLGGLTVGADGNLLLAESSFDLATGVDAIRTLNFENGDNVTHLLVQGFTGALDADLDTNDDGVLEATPWAAIVDGLALIQSAGSGDEVYATVIVGPDGSFVPGHVYRSPDASGAFAIGGFDPASGDDTPGAANPGPASVVEAAIYAIQGGGHSSAFLGQEVRTSGIVTGLYQSGSTNGFWLQDAAGDGDLDTSDGIFVFTGGTAPTVAVGDAVELTGSVAEFRSGSRPTDLTLTELTNPTDITVTSSGNELPAALRLGGAGFQPPTQTFGDDDDIFDSAAQGIDFYERFEGMRVIVESPVAVGPQTSFGEVWTLANNGADPGVGPRTPSGGIIIEPDDFNPERIQIDDDAGFATPVANVGDQMADVTGVVHYGFGNFEVQATEAITGFVDAGLEREVTTLAGNARQLTVATYNVENLDPNDDDGDADIGDGKFAQIAQQIVANLGSPDIVALQEIQDDAGSADDGVVTDDLTLATLVAAIEAAGGPTYRWASLDPADGTTGGQPGGNIRTGYLYNAERVQLDTSSLALIGVGTPAFEDSRPSLVAEFAFAGETVTLINNHWSSKGGSGSLFGVEQPPTNGGLEQREGQAAAVNAAVDAVLAADASANIVVLGDLNEFEFLTPLDIVKGTDGGGTAVLADLILREPANERYEYNFEGNSQTLDHTLVSLALDDASTVFDVVRINSEFADQASDHDPQVTGLALGSTIVVSGLGDGDDIKLGSNAAELFAGQGGSDLLIGLGGNDQIEGGDGQDRLFGGIGDDVLAGGAGSDRLFGKAGADTLIGGADIDLAFGAEGADIFVLTETGSYDLIADFDAAEGDKVRLLIDAVLPDGVSYDAALVQVVDRGPNLWLQVDLDAAPGFQATTIANLVGAAGLSLDQVLENPELMLIA